MRLEQVTTTVLIADEGKILVRKSDGYIAGYRYPLGYNYYEAGVGLPDSKLEMPEDYEDIDIPDDYEVKPIINHVQRLKRAKELIAQNVKDMNNLGLSAQEALEVADWFPEWGVDEGFRVGDTVTRKTKFKFNGKLYAVRQDHTILEHYYPSKDTASLYEEVTEDYNEAGEEMGTLDNPIPYDGNMVLVEGKYYTHGGIVYLCIRDSGNPLFHALKDLVGLYVEPQ